MPPHHWLLGHIPLSASIIGNLPPYAHGVYVGDQIRQRYPHLDSAFYLDNWPLAAPILVVLKPDMMRRYLEILERHMSSLVPGMIEEIKIFKDLLRKNAESGKVMFLEDNGLCFLADRTILWGDRYATHHNLTHWPRAEEFIPERWIVAEGDELYPPKMDGDHLSAEVAMTEIKLMLALTIRDFDFKDAYEEYDVMKGNPKGLNVNGQRAYMMLRGGGHPADHYPCKATFAKRR
ncbi:AflN/verA/monooxygenase [Botrytis cinerea]